MQAFVIPGVAIFIFLPLSYFEGLKQPTHVKILTSLLLLCLAVPVHGQVCNCNPAQYADILATDPSYRTQRAILNSINEENWEILRTSAFTIPRFSTLISVRSFGEFAKQRAEYQAHLTNERVYNDAVTLNWRFTPITYINWKSCALTCLSTQQEGILAYVAEEDSARIVVQIRAIATDKKQKNRKVGFEKSENITASANTLNKKTGLVELVPNLETSILFSKLSPSPHVIINDETGNSVFEYSSQWNPWKAKGLLQGVTSTGANDRIRIHNNYAELTTSSADCQIRFTLRGLGEVTVKPGENRPDLNIICVYKNESGDSRVYEYVIEK